MKRLSILGATGSIGTQCLDVIRQFPNQFDVVALSTHSNIALLKEQIIEFKPQVACVTNPSKFQELHDWVKETNSSIELLCGLDALSQIVQIKQDLVVVSIVGTSGISATQKAIQAGNNIALANKEVLVSAGELIMNEAAKHNVSIIPIDSEHAAIQQCLIGNEHKQNEVHAITLTASGGPFRSLELSKFKDITLEQTLKHPNWEMGNKITVDSATMVNKGLEIIEAKHLFGLSFDKIKAIIHPQSMIHGIVEFIDGNILAHISPTDMRFPIQYALFYPEKKQSPFERLNLFDCKQMTFETIDYKRFPLLKTAISCGEKGGSYPVVFNAANEAAVHLFLNKRIHFMDIQKYIQIQLEKVSHTSHLSIEDIITLDKQIKEETLSLV